MSIANLRKLLEDQEEYPPSETLWQQIINLAKKKTTTDDFNTIQQKMIGEMRQMQGGDNEYYKPSLPEPMLSRFFYKGEYYFLDGKDQIYKTDPSNPLVGNLVGQIIKSTDPEALFEVIIDGKPIHKIKPIRVKPKELYGRHYYMDGGRNIYRGLHSQRDYIHKIGTFSMEGKIILTGSEKLPTSSHDSH